VRCAHPEAFGAAGKYRAVKATGARAPHVAAFLRGDTVMTVVPRLAVQASGRWQGTTIPIPPGRWRNVLSGRRVETGDVDVAGLWEDFPVALLERSGPR
jgi:(1->4)-alpha-D-glucan 1-alpha-D-glucosylmutase